MEYFNYYFCQYNHFGRIRKNDINIKAKIEVKFAHHIRKINQLTKAGVLFLPLVCIYIWTYMGCPLTLYASAEVDVAHARSCYNKCVILYDVIRYLVFCNNKLKILLLGADLFTVQNNPI